MSVQSRLRYHYRNMLRLWMGWRLPSFVDRAAVKVLLIVLVVVMGGAYIVKTNEVSTTGYQIHTLEKQIAALTEDTQKVEIQIASLQAMPNINRRLGDLQMVQPESVTYAKNVGGLVAKR